MNDQTKAIGEALAAPFDPKNVKFKPQVVKDNRCLAMAYIDARLIQDRLDDVLGVGGWSDEYQVQVDGSVVCQLRIKIGDEWIAKTDVGSPSEQPDGGDRLKAAFSDALKRAAVKFGIGRYLYRLPGVWVDFDPVKKRIIENPKLPAWALPVVPRTDADIRERIANAATLDSLSALWESVPAEVRPGLVRLKDERKRQLGGLNGSHMS